MTREDAIKLLVNATYSDEFQGDEELTTAHLMAIKALEQEPCEDTMAIHTQGLDEGIRCAMCTNSMKSNRGCDGGCVVNEGMYREVMNTIEKHIVPPVTPTRKLEQEPCEDCVSRQVVADFLRNHAKDFEDAKVRMAFKAASSLVENANNIPPVTPQPKTGKWILTDDDFVYCSECEDSYYPRPIDASWCYCPNCGAEMEEG